MGKTIRYFIICVFSGIILIGGIPVKGFSATAQSDAGGQNMPAKPTVIETVVSKSQYEALKVQSNCDVALFYVKSDLKIDLSGELHVDDVMEYIKSKPAGAAFVPLFIAKDSHAGTALAEGLNALGSANCIMGSADYSFADDGTYTVRVTLYKDSGVVKQFTPYTYIAAA